MKKEYIVVKFGQEYIEAMPAEKFYEEKESGSFQHSDYEVIPFGNEDEANAYVNQMLSLHQLLYCSAPGLRGLFTDSYFYGRSYREDYYKVLHVGTLEECQEKMAKLKDEYPDEAAILEREASKRRYPKEYFLRLVKKYTLPKWMWESKERLFNDGFWGTIVQNLNEDLSDYLFDYNFSPEGDGIIYMHEANLVHNFLVKNQKGLDWVLECATV